MLVRTLYTGKAVQLTRAEIVAANQSPGVSVGTHATFLEKRYLTDRELLRRYLIKSFARSLSRFVKSRNIRLQEYVRKFNSKPKTFQQLLGVERDKVRRSGL